MSTIKVRAKIKKDVCVIKALITHPMETGRRKDKESGQIVPADYIKEVTVKHKGADVLSMEWGVTVSKNPYIMFKLDGAAKGDEIVLSYVDNNGKADSATTKVK